MRLVTYLFKFVNIEFCSSQVHIIRNYLTILQANEIRQADRTAPVQCLSELVLKYPP